VFIALVMRLLVIQHGSASAIFSSVACRALQYFSTLPDKQNEFRRKKVIGHKMCFDFLYNFCLKHFSFSHWNSSRPLLHAVQPPRNHGQKPSWTVYSTALSSGTECERYWEARTKMMEY